MFDSRQKENLRNECIAFSFCLSIFYSCSYIGRYVASRSWHDNDRGLFMRIIIRFLSRPLQTLRNPRVRHAHDASDAREALRPNAHPSRSWPYEKECACVCERGRSLSRVRTVTQLMYVAMRDAYLSSISIRANNGFREAAARVAGAD